MPQVSFAVDEHHSHAIDYTKSAIDNGDYGRANKINTLGNFPVGSLFVALTR